MAEPPDMAKRWRLLVSVLLAVSAVSQAQDGGVAQPAGVLLHAGQLVDVKAGRLLADQGILVVADRIAAVGPWADLQRRPAERTIDLTARVVLPGLIDAHTHLLANVPDGPGGYTLMLATRGPAYRALEGAANARATLMAGFTTVRDVESEGSGYADVALRDAIAAGLVDGPRMLVATRGIAAVGGYLPWRLNPELFTLLSGAQMVSGADEARRAAREQIRGGADHLKVYADWPDPKLEGQPRPTLMLEELRAVVEEAHQGGRKVAAHAVGPAGITHAVNAGVDKASTSEEREYASRRLEGIRKVLESARKLRVRLVLGSDPAEREAHGRNAEEAVLMVRFGVPPAEVLRAATVDAAALLDLSAKVGTVEVGKQADLIAVDGNPLADMTALRRIRFVMRAGKIYAEPATAAGR